jgi:sterol desaturase/sphingolipid hydroxylase (fatty acid hydroxylase superfamily)
MSVIDGAAIRIFLFWGGIMFFYIFELIYPYRPVTVSKSRRWINNLSLTIFNSILMHLIFSTAIVSAALYVQKNRIGILNIIDLPDWMKIAITLVFMDFMLYIWHLLNHEIPLLWRFHRVHHSDLNMDVSTATRFHIGELSVSAVIKIALIFFLGASSTGIAIFEGALVLCSQFHHSSISVPKWFESFFWILFVPPSMHRIHHSVIIKERNTNYGTIFSVWDRIMGTLLATVNQERIRIGVGAYTRPEKLNFHKLLLMPFTKAVR